MSIEDDRNPGEGAQIADALDQLLRSGGFGQLMGAVPSQPETPPTVDAALTQALNKHIENFCAGISTEVAKEADRRQATNQIRVYFESWKLTSVDFLTRKSAPATEIGAVQNLTLKGVAEYVSEQFRQSRHDAAILAPGTAEYQLARKVADHYSVLDEIIGPAADPD